MGLCLHINNLVNWALLNFTYLTFTAEKYIPEIFLEQDSSDLDLPMVLRTVFCIARESSTAAEQNQETTNKHYQVKQFHSKQVINSFKVLKLIQPSGWVVRAVAIFKDSNPARTHVQIPLEAISSDNENK